MKVLGVICALLAVAFVMGGWAIVGVALFFFGVVLLLNGD